MFLRTVLFVLGVLSGIIGIILIPLPGPGVPILIFITLPCFMRSSKRCHDAILNNRWCGKDIQNWQQYRIISRQAKRKAIFAMSIGLICSIVFIPLVFVKIFCVLCIGLGAVFVATRTSELPHPTEQPA